MNGRNFRFTLENRTADAHQIRLVLSGVPEGDYKVVQDGKTIASIIYREIEEVTIEIPASGIKTHVLEIVKSSLYGNPNLNDSFKSP